MNGIRTLIGTLALALLCWQAAPAAPGETRLPAQLTVIEAEAFLNDALLDRVVIAEGTRRIHARAFAGCALSAVYLPDSLVFIADDAFDADTDAVLYVRPGTYACEWAQAHGFDPALIDQNDRYEYAARGGACEILSCLSDDPEAGLLPSEINGFALTGVADGAFEHRAITRLVVPEGVTRLGARAFAGCALESARLPDSLEWIADDAFDADSGAIVYAHPGTYACEWAQAHNLDTAILYTTDLYEYAVHGDACVITACLSDDADAGLLPSAIGDIPLAGVGEGAFGNSAITSLSVPEGVAFLGARAFAGCAALSTVCLPGSVVEIGQACFADCPALTAGEQTVWYDPLTGDAETGALRALSGDGSQAAFSGWDDQVLRVEADGSAAAIGYGRTTVTVGGAGADPIRWRITVVAPPWILDDYPQRHPLYSVAHRGGKAYWPENTLEAFANSESTGADMIELDVQTTSDGVQVIHHNQTFKVNNTTYDITKSTYKVLKAAKDKLTPGNPNDSLCTLDEALELIAGTSLSLQLEMKVSADPAKCLAAVKRWNMMDRTWFISFYPDLLRQVRAQDNSAKLGLVFDKAVPEDLEEMVYEMRIGAVAPKYTLFTQELLDQWHLMGLLVDTWQGDTVADCRTWSAMGVDLITSNYPDYPVIAKEGRAAN